MRNLSIGGISTGVNPNGTAAKSQGSPKDSPFAQELRAQLDQQNSQGVEFSRHALERIDDRNINMNDGNKLERLNKAVEVAQSKGSNDTLVILDGAAFLVSVKNNKVITTLNSEDMQGSIFTNIDSTVIM